MEQYQVHYEAGSFDGTAGADRLLELLVAYRGKPIAWDVLAIIPVVKDGNSKGVQIVLKSRVSG
jgi:hypothetical protein